MGFGLHGICVMTLLVFVDSGLLYRLWYKVACPSGLDPSRFNEVEDADVTEERLRVCLRVKVNNIFLIDNIYMFVYMYVCMYVCMYACMYVCMRMFI